MAMLGRFLPVRKELVTSTLHLFLISMLIIPVAFSYPIQAYPPEMKVMVKSPLQAEVYECGQIIAVRVEIEFTHHLNYTELTQITTVMITSHWDIQVIRRLPFLKNETSLSGSQIAVYASEGSPPTGPVSGEMLRDLNRRGFIRLPSSPGDYSVTIQVEAIEEYLPYSEEIEFRVVEQRGSAVPVVWVLVFVGWAVIGLVLIFILIKRKIRGK